jgi:RNA polymerase sigma factor (sigma-70 family)
MARIASRTAVRQIASLFEGSSSMGLSDRQLLERFVSGGSTPTGEAAFATLVGRHGGLVLGVCRELIGDTHHAEDAFQAVFLVLARRAGSIREPDLLGNWLYGVAVRTARCARNQIVRRRRREGGDAMNGSGTGPPSRAAWSAASEPAAPATDLPAIDREQAEAIHTEVDRLPRAFRRPVVLCYFEGLTIDEAARKLRCPAGTLHSRLARAREKLRISLSRRRVALSSAALAVALAPRSASASAAISPLLCDATTRAAVQFAAQHAAAGGALSASATALAQEVLQTMLFAKLRLIALTMLTLAAIATGTGWLAVALAMREKPVREHRAPVAKAPPSAQEAPASAAKRETVANVRMIVAGRVLDIDGKPVQGAVVDVVTRPRSPWVGATADGTEHSLLGQGQCDGDGRFQLDAPRTASNRVYEFFALAAAPGFGLGWASLNPDAGQPTAEIRLEREQPIRARVFDIAGAPARGVKVHFETVGRMGDKGNWDGVRFDANPPKGIRAWPKLITSDDEGKILLSGISRGVGVGLQVRDIPYARQDLMIDPAKLASGKEISLTLAPARIIEGRVLAADTGQPIPNAVVSAQTLVMNERARGFFTAKFQADEQGRFAMNPIAGETYTLGAFPTGGEPYLIQQDEFPWPKGAMKTTHDIKLRRGVLIRGRVTEEGTGRPLAASSIQYIPAGGGDNALSGWQAIVASRDDGSFQIAVPPGKGHVLVFGPTNDYILSEIGANSLYSSSPGGLRHRAPAIIRYEVAAGDPPHEIAAVLRPGVTIKGRVEGPDGQTVTDGFVLTTLHIEPSSLFWRGDFHIPVTDGRFELHGLDPKGSTRIWVLDPEHEWGATADLSGRQAGEDLTIRLESCGKASARFVGPDGKGLAKHQPTIEFVATPGPTRYNRTKEDQSALAADSELIINLDRTHYWNNHNADAQGNFTMVSLIPGALYRIIDFSTVNDDKKGPQIRKDFRVKPGETLNLGDILIEKPEAQ